MSAALSAAWTRPVPGTRIRRKALRFWLRRNFGRPAAASFSALRISLFAGLIAALPAAATDLLAAWQAARDHDPVFAAATAQSRTGDAKQRQGRALWLPQLTASAGTGIASSQNATEGAEFSAPGFGTSRKVDFRTSIDKGSVQRWEIAAQQPLYNAERRAQAAQLDRQAELAAVQYRAAEQALILRVAQAYVDVLAADHRLALLRRHKAAISRALDEAKERFDAGDIPKTDVSEAQSRFDAILAEELATADAQQLAQTAFTDLTGLPAEPLAGVGTTPAAAPAPLDDWLARSAQGSLLLAHYQLGEDIARREVDKYRALTSPTLDLVARAGDDRLSGDGDFGHSRASSNSRSITLQLTIPLFTGGMRSARHDEAVALADKARYDVDAARQLAARETRAAWLGVTTGAARVRALEQARRSAAARLGATETGLEAGARTTLDLLNAQADLFSAEFTLTQARHALLLDRLRLSTAVGELGQAEIEAANAQLTP
jgi:outer membrane protein